tara:strand:- start:4838 stop:6187 length:1350 start_codon:yes stop_codon:yes gene_type:complete
MGLITGGIILYKSAAPRKKGLPIVIQIVKDGVPRRSGLKSFSWPSHWDFELEQPNKNHPEFRTLLAKIASRKNQLVDELEYLNSSNCSLEQAIEYIRSNEIKKETKELEIFLLEQKLKELKKGQFHGFLAYYDKIIEQYQKKDKSTRLFVQLREDLDRYLAGEDINIHDIDKDWVEAYKNYKLAGGKFSAGGLSAFLRNMQTVFLAAREDPKIGLNPRFNPFKGNIPRSSFDSELELEITSEDIVKILNYQKPKFCNEENFRKLCRTRDLWMLQIYLGGHDFTEIACLTWKNIQGDRIKFKRHKMRNRENGGPVVNNLLLPEAKLIIKTYGTINHDRVFSFIPDPQENTRGYNNYLGNVNRSLESIRISCDIKAKIRTKKNGPRYIFGTEAGALGFSDSWIEKVQGHKSKRVTRIYRKSKLIKQTNKVIKKVVKSLTTPPPSKKEMKNK